MTDSLVAATDQSVEFIAQLRETEIKFSRPDFEVTLAHFHANPPQKKERKGKEKLQALLILVMRRKE